MDEQPDYLSPVTQTVRPKFGYLPTLDGWRAVAIFMVLCAHGAESISEVLGPRFNGLTNFLREKGVYGVQIFFALSGFLICSRLLVERQQRGSISLKLFYSRRVFRILPPALAYLIIVGVLGVFQIVPMHPQQWLLTLLCASNYIRPGSWYLGHFWSLAVEEHFYMLWPGLVVLLAGWRRGLAGAVVLALAVAAWRYAVYKMGVSDYAAFNARTDLQADSLLWGCALAFLYVREPVRERMAKWLGLVGWLVAVGLMLFTALYSSTDWKLRQLETSAFHLLAPIVIVGTVIHSTGIVGKVLEWKPIRVIGWLSYSIYLWQQLFVVPSASRVAGIGALQQWPWNILATFACATASYLLVEQPLIKLGHRLTRQPPKAASPTLPATPVAA